MADTRVSITNIQGIDNTVLNLLKAQLQSLNDELSNLQDVYIPLHEKNLAENTAFAQSLYTSPAYAGAYGNVVTEQNYLNVANARVNLLKTKLIPDKIAEVQAETQNQINLLSEKAKTDPTALAALQKLQAEQSALNRTGSTTKWIVGTIAAIIIIVVIVWGIRKLRSRNKGK
jgi:hypothetical protein